jgi:hypothetical protein
MGRRHTQKKRRNAANCDARCAPTGSEVYQVKSHLRLLELNFDHPMAPPDSSNGSLRPLAGGPAAGKLSLLSGVKVTQFKIERATS